MYIFNRIGIGFCVLRMLDIFPRAVDGDENRFVVAIVHLFCVIIMTITYKM